MDKGTPETGGQGTSNRNLNPVNPEDQVTSNRNLNPENPEPRPLTRGTRSYRVQEEGTPLSPLLRALKKKENWSEN
jgi:hypothetical protein